MLTLTGAALGDTVGIDDDATLNLQPFADRTFAALISGGGGVQITGAALLTLATSQGYTGGTDIEGGNLSLANGVTLDPSTELTVNNGSFTLGNQNETIGGLNGDSAASVALGTGTLTTGGGDYLGTFSGTGGLTEQGGGSLELDGQLNLSGTITIDASTLLLTADTSQLTSTVVDDGSLVFWQGPISLVPTGDTRSPGRYPAPAGSPNKAPTTLPSLATLAIPVKQRSSTVRWS